MIDWKDPAQRREYYRQWRKAHPGYNAAKMAKYRKGKPARHIVASDFKHGDTSAQRITWDMLEAI